MWNDLIDRSSGTAPSPGESIRAVEPGPHRPRRLRRTDGIRSLVRETRLSVDDLIQPVFVRADISSALEVASMPGIHQWPLEGISDHVGSIARSGVRAVLLFGIPSSKDPIGLESYSPEGIIQQTVRTLRRDHPELVIITDVCLCEYTDHGHCGVLRETERGTEVANDETLEVLSRVAVSHAEAGVDIVAPSGMMDGMVRALRLALDRAGHSGTAIMSYSAKYASAFYGPFRDAAHGAPRFGDRSTHQMDPANAREALREIRLDVEEGADILMVKPALPYLDVVRSVRNQIPQLPLAAYHVSGEYAMLRAAAARGWLDERRAVLETLTSIRRAGADLVITYFAAEAAAWIAEHG